MQKSGVTCTTGTAERVPGLWSLRCPVIQAFSPFSCRLNGRTCTSSSDNLTMLANISLQTHEQQNKPYDLVCRQHHDRNANRSAGC